MNSERRKPTKADSRPKTPVLFTKIVSNQQSEAANNDTYLGERVPVSRIPLSSVNSRSSLLEDSIRGVWHEGEDLATAKNSTSLSSRTSRQIAIRGELAIGTRSAQAKGGLNDHKRDISPRAATPLMTERLTARDIVTPELQEMV